MSQQNPAGDKGLTGIFGLLFREVGLFCEQAYKWGEERATDIQTQLDKGREQQRMEAETRFLEQARLAKQAGLDVDKLLASLRSEQKRLP